MLVGLTFYVVAIAIMLLNPRVEFELPVRRFPVARVSNPVVDGGYTSQ